jgi:death-on-curing protein
MTNLWRDLAVQPESANPALGSAQNAFWYGYGNLFDVIAAYAFHIVESQAFVDGNKRTAAASAISFLRLNGVRFLKHDGSVYRAMIEIANKSLDKRGLAETLRRLVESSK